MIPTLLASAARILWRLIERNGVDPVVVFRTAGLDPKHLEDPLARCQLFPGIPALDGSSPECRPVIRRARARGGVSSSPIPRRGGLLPEHAGPFLPADPKRVVPMSAAPQREISVDVALREARA